MKARLPRHARLPKPISPDVHGVLDYTSLAGLLVMSRTLPLPQRVRRLLQSSACFTLAYSLLTRYRFGLMKILPMQGHLALDLTSAIILLTSPETLRVEKASTRRLLRGLGVFETVVPLLTRSQ